MSRTRSRRITRGAAAVLGPLTALALAPQATATVTADAAGSSAAP